MASPQEDRKKLEEAIQSAKVNSEYSEMLQGEYSKLLYHRYLTLKSAGFTDDQALEIVKARGIT